MTPTLTITGDSAVYELTATTKVAVGNFYDYGKAQKLASVEGTKEQYIKNQYEDLKKQLELYNNMKGPLSFEFNDEKYEIHQTLKEITINESTGTFEFKNAPMFIDLVTFSNEKFIKPVSYKYSIEDGILTLTLEQPKTLSGEEKIVGYFTMRFKKSSGIIYSLGPLTQTTLINKKECSFTTFFFLLSYFHFIVLRKAICVFYHKEI